MVGSVIDTILALWAAYLVVSVSTYDWTLSIDTMLKTHFSWLYWAKSVAVSMLSASIANWLFSLPAIIVLGIRGVVSTVIARWAFSKARLIEA